MKTGYTVEKLRDFENEVIRRFELGEIRGPVHLSHGNEKALIEIFDEVSDNDWVFSTWRNHYHALLKGIPAEWLMDEILSCRSINISNGDYKFHTSAIVGGILPIATGVAAGIKLRGGKEKVWCFIGDMSNLTGMATACKGYAVRNDLPITFVIEDNGFSTNTPSLSSFYLDAKKFSEPEEKKLEIVHKFLKYEYFYHYKRKFPHVGIGKWVTF